MLSKIWGLNRNSFVACIVLSVLNSCRTRSYTITYRGANEHSGSDWPLFYSVLQQLQLIISNMNGTVTIIGVGIALAFSFQQYTCRSPRKQSASSAQSAIPIPLQEFVLHTQTNRGAVLSHSKELVLIAYLANLYRALAVERHPYATHASTV